MTEPALIHLIYCSTATHEMSQAELLDLLRQSRKLNEQLKLTGMLLYGGGVFMQVQEGIPAAVDMVYQKICRDPRHHSLILLEREPVSERSFAGWSMGFHHLEAEAGQQFAGAFALNDAGSGLEDKACRPGLALDILRQFARTQR